MFAPMGHGVSLFAFSGLILIGVLHQIHVKHQRGQAKK
jgi:hypothetical protein